MVIADREPVTKMADAKPASPAVKEPSRLSRAVSWLLDGGDEAAERVAARYQKSGMMTAFPGQGSSRDRDNKRSDRQQKPR